MILTGKKRKFQLGGSLNQAKNEVAPIDIRWKQFDLSSSKLPEMNQHDGKDRNQIEQSDGGIPSDVSYVDSQLKHFRDQINKGLTGSNSEEYSNSPEFKQDSEQLNKWAQAKTMLKSREENYKAKRSILQKGANDNYAIYGNKALAKDNANNGDYTIVDLEALTTERIKNQNGAMSNRYTPATIGDALAVRYEDPRFSGFVENAGGVLDNILSNVVDTDEVTKEMDKLFSQAGSVNQESGTFMSAQGKSMSVSDLINTLGEASTKYSNMNIQSNESNLQGAVAVFANNINPTHYESLKNKATAQFVRSFGNQQVTSDFADRWIKSQVMSEIAKRAMVFLNEKVGKTKGSTSGKSAGATDDDKKMLETNKETLARIEWSGETLPLETSYNKATHMNIAIGNVPVTRLDIGQMYNEGMPKDAKSKTPITSIGENSYIKTLTEGDVVNNLFLADEASTPLADINEGTGLSNAILSKYDTKMRVLKGMPYTVDKNGKYRIAWESMGKVATWNDAYGKMYKEYVKKNNVSGKALTREQEEEIIESTAKEVKFNIFKDFPEVKIGDIAMLPILVLDKGGFDDTNELDHVMSSEGLRPDEKTYAAEQLDGDEDEVRKTFAFTVLPDNPSSTDPEHYGSASKLSKKFLLKDIIEANKSMQTKSRGNSFIMQALVNSAVLNTSDK